MTTAGAPRSWSIDRCLRVVGCNSGQPYINQELIGRVRWSVRRTWWVAGLIEEALLAASVDPRPITLLLLTPTAAVGYTASGYGLCPRPRSSTCGGLDLTPIAVVAVEDGPVSIEGDGV